MEAEIFQTSTAHPAWFLALSLGLALVPAMLGMFTSYLKISVVLHLLRSGLGIQQVPSASVIMALSLALTCYIMAPQFESSMERASELEILDPELAGEKITLENLEYVLEPWKSFMHQHSGARELELFSMLSIGENQELHVELEEGLDPGWRILLPAYVVSELQKAFLIGFLILLPFLVIDLIVSNVLVGMGMFMVSPVLIALPLKLALFVLSDGWMLLARGLVYSYQGG